jgi:hypothetical protein
LLEKGALFRCESEEEFRRVMEKIPEYKIKPEKVRIETSLTISKGQPHEMNGLMRPTEYGIQSTYTEVCDGGFFVMVFQSKF